MSRVQLGLAVQHCVGRHGHEIFSTPELSTSPLVIRQNFVHSQNQCFGAKVDAEYSGKILAMIARSGISSAGLSLLLVPERASSSKIWLSASNC